MDIVQRIFDLVQEQNMEQKKFALLIGVSPQKVSEWKNGKAKSYTKYIQKIAEVLNTTVQYLLTGEGEKNKQAAIPKDDSLSAEFARLFDALTPEHKNEIIAEMLKRQRDK